MSEDPVFTTVEVAEKLRTHRYTVYKLLRDGRLTGFRVSNQWRIRESELNKFMSMRGDRSGRRV